MELLILSEWKLIIQLQAGEINYFFKKNYQNKIGLFVQKSHVEGRGTFKKKID